MFFSFYKFPLHLHSQTDPSLLDEEHELVSRCLKKEKAAEKQLYHRFAPLMFGICMRYGGNEREAEDILQNGFMHLFSHLHQFGFKGPLEKWVRPIFVHTAINYYFKGLKYNQFIELHSTALEVPVDEEVFSIMSTAEMLGVIQRLPLGYRTIFNMNVIDGYEHKEIANMLGISEETSKSQLSRAKNYVRRILIGMDK